MDTLRRIKKDSVSGYPSDTYTSPNDYIHRLKGNATKIGSSIVLKVMTGDTVNIHAKSWYKLNSADPTVVTNPLTDLVNALVANVPGASGGKFGSGALEGSLFAPSVTDLLTDRSANQYNNTRPKAYLNYLFFDEQMKPDIANSGFIQVGTDNTLSTLTAAPTITRNGYLYIYVSNESNDVNVYFDNLQVSHYRGALLEETHYYPFGLTMAGISSKAAGKLETKARFNGYEQQSKEFSDGSGLEWYDYKHRFYDNQIGRFFSADALADKYPYYSVYQFAGNEPTRAIDIDGLEPWYTIDGNRANASGPYSEAYMNPKGMYSGKQVAAKANAGNSQAVGNAIKQDNRSSQQRQEDYLRGEANQRLNKMYDNNSQEAQSFGIVAGMGAAASAYLPGLAIEMGIARLAQGSVWGMNALQRGFEIEKMLGGDLPNGFPVIDKVKDGVATSIKSIDVTLGSYNKGNGLLNTLNGYINKLSNFTGGSRGGATFQQGVDFTSKSLEVAIQPGKASLSQWEQIGQAMKNAKDAGIEFKIQFIR